MQFCFEGVHGIKLSVIVDVKSQYPLVSETKYKEICLLGFNQKSCTALFHYVSSFLSWKTPGISKSLSSMDAVKGICDEPFSQLFADDYVNSVTLGHILELLTFCIEHHTYHIKNYVINKDLLRRVLVLMKSRHKFLVLSKFTFLLKSWCSFSSRDFC